MEQAGRLYLYRNHIRIHRAGRQLIPSKVTLHNTVVGIAAFTPQTLLYGLKEFGFDSNSKHFQAALTFIHQTERFEDEVYSF